MSKILGLHHVQITIPRGAEVAGRAFYVDVLGLMEVAKPSSLAGRGGFWVQLGGIILHIGTEDGMDRLKSKVHVAYEVDDLEAWWKRLENAGISPLTSIPIPGYNRFECRDPFGNRLEFIMSI